MNRRALLAVAFATVLATRRASGEDSLSTVLDGIRRARAGVRTIRGRFTQTRLVALLATEIRSQGSFELVMPDRLRWALEPPDDVVFWMTPEAFAYASRTGRGRLPGDAPSARGLSDLRTALCGDLAKLRPRWSLRVVQDDARGVEIEATTTPTGADSPHAIELGLAPDLVRPVRARLLYGGRDRTTIEMSDVGVDVPIDAADMTPPP